MRRFVIRLSTRGGKILLAVEWESDAAETYKMNFPNTPLYHGDIAKLSIDEALKIANIKPGELDVFDGSPPCQGFSTAGKRAFGDERNNLFKEYCRLVEGFKPKVLVMENVSGMIKGDMKIRFTEIHKTIEGLGYKVKARLLNAANYGVPQIRERVIFIGVRNDIHKEPSHPTPKGRVITVGDAIADCPDIEDKPMKEWLKGCAKQIKSGMSYGDKSKIFIKAKGTSGSAISCIRLSWNKPSYTITKSEIAASGLIHPNGHRYLNSLELKRLGSFPDDFKFTSRKNACIRIGNAVPPLLMKAIAENIRDNILN